MPAKLKYPFSWDLLGDLALGRPNLGPTTRVELYRLMQFSLRDAMERDLGSEKTDQLFYEAGKSAGFQFYTNVIGRAAGLDELVKRVQSTFKEMGVGIFRVEQSDIQKGSFIFTVSEDLDCSGLPELNYPICTYDEGFISGLMEAFSGKRFKVKEIDCWCTGDRTCRFTVEALS